MLLLLLAAPAQAREDDPIEVGAFVGAQIFPAASSAAAVSPDDSIALGVRGGYLLNRLVSLEADVDMVPTAVMSDGVLVTSVRAHALLHLRLRPLERKNLVPFVSAGGGVVASAFASPEGSQDSRVTVPLMGTDTRAVLDGGLGLKFFPIPRLGLRLDLRLLWSPGDPGPFETPRFEILFGAYARLGGAAPLPHAPGTPAATDPDGDGIYGDADKCPDEPEDVDGFEDADGCPDPDNDGDLISDWRDDCPNLPEDMDGFQDDDGCPEPDNDNDGIADAEDKCPLDPEDKDGFQDADGCPDPDNDGDGIADAQDRCPDEPEAWNGFQDEDGCADEVPKDLAAIAGEMKGVTFPAGSDKLKGSKGLDAVAVAMNRYLNVHIEIAVHSGPAKKSKTPDKEHAALVALTQRRANALKEYLIRKGVEAARVKAMGYGPDRPKGARGVERVEVKIVVAEHPEPQSQPASQPSRPADGSSILG